MRITWYRAGVTLLGILLAAGTILVSGVVPIRASSEHWPVTRWFLDFAMSRSVSFHTRGISVPELDDPALVLQGAGHYEFGCSPCHGSPIRGRSEVVREMTPHPPLLSEVLHLWEPAELFYIVRHGVKFTAMPAWPVPDRDDEVWAMVAFLLEMREMDGAEYRRLAFGEAEGAAPSGDDVQGETTDSAGAGIPSLVRSTCGRCHGMEGGGRGTGAFPTLAGQTRRYLANSLLAFARAERLSGTMHTLAAPLTTATIEDLSAYFAEQSGSGVLMRPEDGASGLAGNPPPGITPGDPSAADGPPSAERGELIAQRGLPELEVPACAACHGPGSIERNPAYPILAGQYPRYLATQLQLFREEVRGGSEFVRLMHAAVRRLEDGQIDDLAAYYGSLGGGEDDLAGRE